MSSPLQQIADRDGLLLMYLADELSAGDRAEVERTLAGDVGLRAELEQLRQTQSWLESALAASDAAAATAGPMPSQAVAVRRVGQAVRRWHAERLARPPADAGRRGRDSSSVLIALFRRQWMYPAAAAAIVVMAFLANWSSRPIPTETVFDPPDRPGGGAVDERPEPVSPPGNDPYVQLLALAAEPRAEMVDLTEAERQMSALSALPEEVSAGVIPDLSAE
jgi:hypothetical protein